MEKKLHGFTIEVFDTDKIEKFSEVNSLSDKNKSYSRIYFIDFVRGIVIILVVFGHNLQYGSGSEFYKNELYFQNVIFKIIYSFHMPIFALLSGYLFFFSMKKDIKIVLKRRVSSLIFPIFIWKTIETFARLLLGRIKINNFLQIYINDIIYDLWFLWAIFWCSIAVIVIERLIKGKFSVYLFLLVLTFFVPTIFGAHMYIYMYPYFAAGFLFNKINGTEKYKKYVKRDLFAVSSAAVIFSLLILFYNYNSYIYTSHISILEADNAIRQFGIDIYRYIIGFVGSIAVIILCKMIYNKYHNSDNKVIKLVEKFGQNSMGIYILNTYVNTIFLLPLTKSFSPNILIWVFETILSFIFYSVAIFTIKKVPYANKVLFGGR